MKLHRFIGLLVVGSVTFVRVHTTFSQSMVPSLISPYGQGARARSDTIFKFMKTQFEPPPYMISPAESQKDGVFQLSLKGFFPFRDSLGLQIVYDSQQINGLNMAGYSFPPADLTNAKAKLLYVDLVSFIPDNSWFRISLGTHLVQSDAKDDSAKTQQDIALQKLLNGGGNVFLNISRPVYYWPTILVTG